MVSALEADIDALEATQEMPVEFVLPGESMTGAALDLARSRGATRGAPHRGTCQRPASLPDSHVLAYLNRLADLLFVAARAADGGFRPVREAASRIAPAHIPPPGRLHRRSPALAWRMDKETHTMSYAVTNPATGETVKTYDTITEAELEARDRRSRRNAPHLVEVDHG